MERCFIKQCLHSIVQNYSLLEGNSLYKLSELIRIRNRVAVPSESLKCPLGEVSAGMKECFHVGDPTRMPQSSFDRAPTSKRFHYSCCCNTSSRAFYTL
jgi:hypothetical protein